MNVESFKAQVDAIVKKDVAKMDAVVKGSLQDLITEAQTPTGKGGNMRVDTGFLRASGQASLSGMPSGPTRGESKDPDSYQPSEANKAAAISGLKPGGTLWFGWSAVYAAAREFKDGFLAGALQNWQKIVDANVRKLK
jgi:hypothetical protein